MPWSTLPEAATALGVSRATLERRVAGDEVASHLAADGRRLVWVSPLELEPEAVALRAELASLRSTVERLAGLVEGLVGRRGPAADAPGSPRIVCEGVGGYPATPSSENKPARSSAGIPEAEVLELLDRVSRLGLPDVLVAREAGLSVSFLCKARAGGGRTGRASSSWASLRCWLDGQSPAVVARAG